MKLKFLILVGCIFWGVTQTYAQIMARDNVVIREAINDDLYVAGGTVTINAPIHGDLVVTGGTIIVNDSIVQDILVAGGNVTINGFVGDDVRCAGGVIELSKDITGDLIVAGGRINIDKSATIAGDLLATGGEVAVGGDVKGSIRNASGKFTLDGKVGKDLVCKGGEILINGIVHGSSVLAANTIQLGSGARFENDIKYWNKKGSLDFGNTIQGGKATFDTSLAMENGRWHYLGFASMLMVLWYLGTALVMIVLLQYLFAFTFKNAANTIKNTSLKSLGLGFLFIVGIPIAIVISFITIIGLPVAALLFIGYVTSLLLATVIVSLLISNWVNNTYYQSAWEMGRIIFTAFGIFIILKLASLTPVVGPLIMLLLICMGIGGILQNVRWKRNEALALT